MEYEKYLKETKLLDYSSNVIQKLIKERNFSGMNSFHKIQSIYEYVRDEILFGYNVDDDIPASKVLQDGYGQCNTKGTLLMALLRAVRIPCRVHGFTIDKQLQKGVMKGFVYRKAPKNVFHSWVEVLYEGKWYVLEGVILDQQYLQQLQKKFNSCKGAFRGYGVAVKDFQHPVIQWNCNDTFIQSEGISQDFGVYESPDTLLAQHHQDINFVKTLLYRYFGRHRMNHNVSVIRNQRNS